MSQIAEFHAAILQNLPDLSPAEMQEWIGPSRSNLRSGLSFLKQQQGKTDQFLTETKLLRPVATATLAARTTPIDLDQFFRARSGLCVWDLFREHFDLGVVTPTPERPYVASLLKADAYDQDIRKELPQNHLSTLEDVVGLIEAQPNGEKGLLHIDGSRPNICYVIGRNGQVFAVYFVWCSVNREWLVRDWKLGERGEWNAGYQVLCPGNAAL